MARAVQRPRPGRREACEHAGGVRDHGACQPRGPEDRAPGRQYQPCRRQHPVRRRRRGRAVALAHGPHPRGRSALRQHDRGSRRDAAARAGGGRRGRSPVPALAGIRGHLHHRRQSRHQCRRHGRAGLRQHPRTGAGPRSGAGGWPHLERPRQAAQGQYRLRFAPHLHRLGRHARHHHGRRPEAVPQAARPW